MAVLFSIRCLEILDLKKGLPLEKRIRKGQKYRAFNEIREGCLFALGYQILHSLEKIEVAWANESMDADVIFRIGGTGGEYIPVQLKAIPSERFNPENVLQAVLDGLAGSLADSNNTLVGIYLTRRIEPDFYFTIPANLKVKALHFFGGIDATAWHFGISEDLLTRAGAGWKSFSYPWPEGGEIPPAPFDVTGALSSRIDPRTGRAINT